MIQKIQKAQALSEMALFGSIILLCFYYLLTYLQRVDRQQYLLQESFRSALKKASAPENGSVAYNTFSNRRQVSIYSPLIGERSQLSGSGQVYWGAVEYYLPAYDPDIHGGEDGEDYGPEVVTELKSKQYYKFNKDEIDLTDTLEGDKSGEDEEEEESINSDIVITSDSDGDSLTTITYSDSNISTQSRAGEKDTVTYTLTDKDSGGAIYTISQGLDSDGEYSQAAVGTKVYNVMREGNEDLDWTVSK
jgi:hypothetical protein